MNDDSAEWMAMFKASGQLRPATHEERGGDEDEARMGVVTDTNDEGRQVLGTCWPERWACVKAALSHLFVPHRPQLTEEQQQSVDEQTRVRTAWIRDNSRWEQP